MKCQPNHVSVKIPGTLTICSKKKKKKAAKSQVIHPMLFNNSPLSPKLQRNNELLII